MEGKVTLVMTISLCGVCACKKKKVEEQEQIMLFRVIMSPLSLFHYIHLCLLLPSALRCFFVVVLYSSNAIAVVR